MNGAEARYKSCSLRFAKDRKLNNNRYSHRRRARPRRGAEPIVRRRFSPDVRLPLILVIVVALAAYATHYFTGSGDQLRGLDIANSAGSRRAPIVGIASVIDGDTIEIHGQRVRFNGIDAPESRQYCNDASAHQYPCGRRAAEALANFLAASQPVQCTFVHGIGTVASSVIVGARTVSAPRPGWSNMAKPWTGPAIATAPMRNSKLMLKPQRLESGLGRLTTLGIGANNMPNLRAQPKAPLGLSAVAK